MLAQRDFAVQGFFYSSRKKSQKVTKTISKLDKYRKELENTIDKYL
jgi:hypothetical protein